MTQGVRLRWRREAKETGLRRVTQGTRGWELYATFPDKTVDLVAMVSLCKNRGSMRPMWYAVTIRTHGVPHKNSLTTHQYWADPEYVKANLLNWVKARIKP